MLADRRTCWTCAGALDARAGQAAYDAIILASRLALEGKVDAITTAPLQKEALHRAGHDYPGHTELLAHLCGVDDFAMMLYVGPGDDVLAPYGLTVVHVTLHTALKNAIASLTPEGILAKARLADRFMSRLMRRSGPEQKRGKIRGDWARRTRKIRGKIGRESGSARLIRMPGKGVYSATKDAPSSGRPSSKE